MNSLIILTLLYIRQFQCQVKGTLVHALFMLLINL